MKSMFTSTAVATLAIVGLAGLANAAPVTVENADFEDPILADGGSTSTINGWTQSGSGSIVNPTTNSNAYDANVYRSTGSTLSQSVGALQDGTYTLTVEVGARPAAVFGTYTTQLVALTSIGDVVLAEDANSQSGGMIPGGVTADERFETSTVTFDTSTGIPADVNLGDPLVVRLVGTNEANFDNVTLNYTAGPGPVVVYLQAQAFDKVLPDNGTVPMWGFASCTDDTYTTCTAAADTDAPGPLIQAFADDGTGTNTLTINVKNTLPMPISIVIPGQLGEGDMIRLGADRVQSFAPEVMGGGSTGSYTFSSLKSGTYLYQSGTFPSLQVPMGLYGALVVYEADGVQAYSGITPNIEGVLLFSEIDPVQNLRVSNAAASLGAPDTTCISISEYNASMLNGYPCTIDYDPMYLLVNGAPTADLPSAPGDLAMLRLLNAGLRSHTPSIVGLEMDLIAEDGNLYPGLPRRQSAVLLAAGKTIDALAILPATDISLSLFDRMPTFSNEIAPNGGSLGGFTVGAGTPADPPTPSVANDDGPYAVVEDQALNTTIAGVAGVLDNDTINVTPTVVSDPSNGTVTLNVDGSFVYTPNTDFSGADSFIYSITDAGGATYLAQVALNVSFENDVPQAAADGPYANSIGTTISVAAPGVLGNDMDVDGDTLTAVLDAAVDGLVLASDGSFTYSGAALGPISFSYHADDGTDVSDSVTVSLNLTAVADIALTVQDPGGTAVTDYRWTVEEEAMWQPDPYATTLPTDTLATNFHKSHMPIVAQGTGAGEFAQLALDPAKHYYVSVLPADAATGTGHTIGGARIPPGADAVTVIVNQQPLPVAQISMFVFEDNSPTNGSVDGNEKGLGGFQVTLEDAGGRYGVSAGTLSLDAFGNPLTNALDCFGGSPPSAGVITSCPDTPENRAAGVVGEVLIKNLYPGKYGVITSPPLNSPDQWSQTSTIEGTKVIDAWVKAGEPAFFQEFGPAGWHVFVGFVSPVRTAAVKPAGANSITGRVTNMHMSRPPDAQLHDSGTFDALSFTRAWVGLNSANGTGPNYAAVQAADDGSFTISGVPDGLYQLVVWDAYLDVVIAYKSVSVSGGVTLDAATIPVFQWFTRSEHTVFLDDGCGDGSGVALDGIRQECEAPIGEQAVNLRWRDGTVYQSMPTDGEGFVPFDQTFPFFHWQVMEVDYARFKATGVTTVVDGGGDVSGTGTILNPQIQADGTSDSRTEVGPVLSQGYQGFLGQTSTFAWGKAPYEPGENGGISGIVYYASTRAENNPRLAAAEPWEPGVPSATIRLYREVNREPSVISIADAGFEDTVLGEGGSTSVNAPWVQDGIGSIVNPTNNSNAFDANVYRSVGGTLSQTTTEAMQEGTYTLSVEVGARPAASFGTYQLQLGIDTGTEFVVLAEDNNSKSPNPNGTSAGERFETASVSYTAAANDQYIDNLLAVRLIATNEVNFDNVTLTLGESALALVAETQTDSWDNSLPTDCPGAHPDDFLITGGQVNESGPNTNNKCYDGLRNFNQVRPAVFDGGYAFMDIPPGKYIVEVVPPQGYDLVKEESNNVGFGDSYNMAPVSPPWPGAILPDAAMVNEAFMEDPGLAQPPCVGEVREVPATLSMFPGEAVEAPFAGAWKPLCDRKEVVLSDQGQAAADFFLHTEAPVAGHFVGMILDDVAQEFNPLSPQFGEKWAPPFVPVSIRDHEGREISRVYSDQWGRMNGLLPSTFTANMPSPSGFAPAMLMTCMNDPGPIPDPNTPTQMIVDPQFNPAYSNFCYTFQYMPGTTTYLDTPVVPVSAFASGYNPPDCALDDGTPKIQEVSSSLGFGPLVAQGGTLTIESQGMEIVPNPAYDGPGGAERKTTTRDYGFGGTPGTVTLDGVPLDAANLSWTDGTITWSVPDGYGEGEYQLVVTHNNGNSTEHAVTVTVTNALTPLTPIRVPTDYSTIQAAIEAAPNNALILVAPGSYDENVIMWKPVRLQGAGAGSTMINAVKRPTNRIAEWRERMDCLFGLNGCTQVVDALPTQLVGAAGFDTDEGAAVTVVAPFDAGSGAGRPANRFRGRDSRIDGFSITGGDTGGGIFVNGYAHQLEISNNHVFGNNGSYHGGIRIGRPFLELDDDGPYGFNVRVSVHNNAITQNGGLDGAGGGLSIATGSDRYEVIENFVCGNFAVADGGGIGHLGLSDRGVIADNRILFNQSFDQAQTRSGGGLFIGGEVPVAGDLTKGTGRVTVDGNLIQGNHAGAGHGGGIRTQFVNGRDVLNTVNPNNGRARPGRWWRVDITNNMIVNNVAGWSGAGISMQDTARSFVVNNTVAHNDSTATVAATFTTGDPNVSAAQPAGISSEPHSPELNAAIPVQGNTAARRDFSNPLLSNNIVWQNRSSHYEVTGGAAGLVPSLSADCTGDYVDYGVLGTGGFTLSPGSSIDSATDPQLAVTYCNGGRGVPGPMQALPALDEGGAAWVDVRYGPLQPGGDYHLTSGSPAIDAGSPQRAPDTDFDRESRPLGGGFDIGADELDAPPQPFVAYSSGEFGEVSIGDVAELTITATVSGADVTFAAGPIPDLAAPFAMTADTCSGATIGVGTSCSFIVTYAPTADGVSTESFAVDSNAAGNPHTIDLSGLGVTLGTVEFTSAAPYGINGGVLEFGALPNGDHETTVTLTVSDAPVLFELVTISGSRRFGKSAEDGADTCSGSLIGIGETCVVTIEFNANGNNQGEMRTAALEVPHFGANSPQSLQITGR